MAILVRIDKDRCIASGACVMHAPDVFTLDDDGIVELLQSRPSDDLREDVKAAAAGCPAWLITVEEADDPSEFEDSGRAS